MPLFSRTLPDRFFSVPRRLPVSQPFLFCFFAAAFTFRKRLEHGEINYGNLTETLGRISMRALKKAFFPEKVKVRVPPASFALCRSALFQTSPPALSFSKSCAGLFASSFAFQLCHCPAGVRCRADRNSPSGLRFLRPVKSLLPSRRSFQKRCPTGFSAPCADVAPFPLRPRLSCRFVSRHSAPSRPLFQKCVPRAACVPFPDLRFFRNLCYTGTKLFSPAARLNFWGSGRCVSCALRGGRFF